MYVHVHQRLNVLESEGDEQRVQEILARLKVEVSRRRLLLYPYFRDFDRVSHLHVVLYNVIAERLSVRQIILHRISRRVCIYVCIYYVTLRNARYAQT